MVRTQDGNRPRSPSAARSWSVNAVPLLSKGSRNNVMPCGGLEGVEWTPTRSGLFTNSPEEGFLFDLTASIVGHAMMEIKDITDRAPVVISHRSDVFTF
jgi:hypothetical protein